MSTGQGVGSLGVALPSDFLDALGVVAYVFKFQPSEIDEMTLDDLLFWVEQARRINGEIETALNNT